MNRLNRKMRRIIAAIGMAAFMIMMGGHAFAWSNDPYYVGVFQGNVSGNPAAPMLLIPNGGGSDGNATCANIYFLSHGVTELCGACLVGADEASRTYLSESMLLPWGSDQGVIKIIASAPVNGKCNASNFGYAQSALDHILPEVCDGPNVSGACKDIRKTVAQDPQEYLKLMQSCTPSKTFVQARCQDP